LDAIEEWKNTTGASDRGAKYSALSSNAKKFADKVKRGQDSYVVYQPVARQTERLSYRPTAEPCGILQNPPYGLQITGYEYLKTADRVTRQGKYFESAREWSGAEFWDHDIYSY